MSESALAGPPGTTAPTESLPDMLRALTESEARYKALVTATAQFVWRRGAHNNPDPATDAWWEALTGQAPDRANGDFGQGWLEQLHPDDRERAREAWACAFSRRVLFDTEYRVRARDGAYRHFAVRGVPVGDDPTAQEWIGTFTDVTAAREAEAERSRLLAEAEAANRAKAEFLAVMSHELRTPLNAISGYVELMELGIHGPVTTEQQAVLVRIRAAQRTLLRHVNDVLNFARLEAGRVEFDVRPVPVRDLLVGAEALIRPQANTKGVRFTCGACDETLVVHADAEKAEQVVLNLVANAVKFTPAGGDVCVSAEIVDDTWVAIRVADTGVGIPAAKLPGVFEPFVQIRTPGESRQDGTGLGLAISRDLMHGMGGELIAASEVGKGSTFTMRLRSALSVPSTLA